MSSDRRNTDDISSSLMDRSLNGVSDTISSSSSGALKRGRADDRNDGAEDSLKELNGTADGEEHQNGVLVDELSPSNKRPKVDSGSSIDSIPTDHSSFLSSDISYQHLNNYSTDAVLTNKVSTNAFYHLSPPPHLLPSSSAVPASVINRFRHYFHIADTRQLSFLKELEKQKDYYAPNVYQRIRSQYLIQEYQSNFSEDIFDPYCFIEDDFIEKLKQKAIEKEKQRVEQSNTTVNAAKAAAAAVNDKFQTMKSSNAKSSEGSSVTISLGPYIDDDQSNQSSSSSSTIKGKSRWDR